VLMIGGPMHMPCVRSVIGEVFARNESVSREMAEIEAHGFPVNPMECVAQGAALYGQEVVEAPPNQLPYHYGLALRTPWGAYQGKVVLERGRTVPCEGTLEGLTAHGQPGDAIPVSIYTWEVGPDGGYQLIGDFRFSPAFDTKGVARFAGVLQADRNGVVSALWSDMRVANAPLRLEGLNELRGEPMPEPLDIQEVDLATVIGQLQGEGMTEEQIRAQLQEMTQEGELANIPQERVAALRRASESLVNLAESSTRRDPQLAGDAQLSEAIANLRRALQHLPRGASPYPAWAAVAHGAEELFLPLERAGVLSKDDVRALRGELGGGGP